MIAVCRLRYCPRTQAYATKRTTDGLNKREILRRPAEAHAEVMLTHSDNPICFVEDTDQCWFAQAVYVTDDVRYGH